MDQLAFHRAIVDLHGLFENPKYGHGNLLHYLCTPRIEVTTYDFGVMRDNLLGRLPPDQHARANCAPADVGIFTRRANILRSNPRAFALAVKEELDERECDEVSYMDWSWSWLFALKMYLMHRPALARTFRGLLPFGSQVIAYCNTLKCREHSRIPATPEIGDHLWLRDLCNAEASWRGIPSVEVNNEFYILGG